MGRAEIVTSASALLVRLQHLAEIHAIELVAREDQHVVDARLLDVPQVLPHGVGGALVPVGVVQRLLGGQDFDEAAARMRRRYRCGGCAGAGWPN